MNSYLPTKLFTDYIPVLRLVIELSITDKYLGSGSGIDRKIHGKFM